MVAANWPPLFFEVSLPDCVSAQEHEAIQMKLQTKLFIGGEFVDAADGDAIQDVAITAITVRPSAALGARGYELEATVRNSGDSEAKNVPIALKVGEVTATLERVLSRIESDPSGFLTGNDAPEYKGGK